MSYVELRPVSTAPGPVNVERVEQDGRAALIRSNGDVEDVGDELLVATRSFAISYQPCAGAAWQVDEITAGVTRCIASHDIVQNSPDAWITLAEHEARAKVERSADQPPPVRTHVHIETEVVIRERAERPVVLHITRDAFVEMKLAAMDDDTVECGGGLYGPARASYSRDWLVDGASEIGREKASHGVRLR